MGRAFLSLLFFASSAVAAPPPKESAENRFHRMFGTIYDPGKDCSITLDGSRLKIQIPGTPHRFTPGYESEKSTAPRVRREISGDFDIRIKVVSLTPPGPKSEGMAMTAGGLFVGTDDDKFITMSRYINMEVGGTGNTPQFLFQHRLPDSSASELGLPQNNSNDKPIYLRLVRKTNQVNGYTSSDGKAWTLRGTQSYVWPHKVYVGVFASHGVNHAVEAVFEDFQVTQPTK
ncbi:MAG TPA: hypothetical protein VGJ05_13320 [Fimbriiglobus sp.]|jgi:hypothetical protein